MSDDPFHEINLRTLLEELESLRGGLLRAEREASVDIAAVHESARASARNLIHYVALRQVDVRPLQASLSALGLSSLGRAEAHVLDTLEAVIHVLRRLLFAGTQNEARCAPPSGSLSNQTEALLGKAPPPLIMVTMPSEAALSDVLVRQLLDAGMNVMRVNCAHDDETAHRAMVAHLRQACAETGQLCRVLFDLPGPKLRTLGVEPGPRVIRLHPERDALGRVTQPAKVYLTASHDLSLGGGDATIRLAAPWVARLARGDVVHVHDPAGRTRTLDIVSIDSLGARATTQQTVYVTPDTPFTLMQGQERFSTLPCDIPVTPGGIKLRVGDALRLTREPRLGAEPEHDDTGHMIRAARIACAVPEIVEKLRVGDPVWFDDGKIGGEVEALSEGEALIRIGHAKSGGSTLRAGRGINLPLTPLDLPTLSEEDLAALDCAVEVADMIGLSYARRAEDVRVLHAALQQRSADKLGVVLKIETKRGFEELPNMLLEALKRPPVGVMIARGDLAVECGFERLAELQEEILWICEAAHVPCIWATQVLESLTKKGAASRAEITDAAMAERAECVMLNKGPHVVQAVVVLRDIMARMRDHQQKKTSMLRPLRSIRVTSSPSP